MGLSGQHRSGDIGLALWRNEGRPKAGHLSYGQVNRASFFQNDIMGHQSLNPGTGHFD